MLKLLRSWKSLQKLISAVLASAESLCYLLLLCALCVLRRVAHAFALLSEYGAVYPKAPASFT